MHDHDKSILRILLLLLREKTGGAFVDQLVTRTTKISIISPPAIYRGIFFAVCGMNKSL